MAESDVLCGSFESLACGIMTWHEPQNVLDWVAWNPTTFAVPAEAIGNTPMPMRSHSFVVPSSTGRRTRKEIKISAAIAALPIESQPIQPMPSTRLA